MVETRAILRNGVEQSPLPIWLVAIVIAGAALMATGGLIALIHPALLVSPTAEINSATHVYAGYLVSRNLAIAAMLLATLGIRSRTALASLMTLTAFIQLLDAAMDVIEGRWVIVPGVLIFGILFLFGAARLSGRVLWKATARQDAA
jgi:hypothetical protein